MNNQEKRVFHRPPFTVDGVIVARREVRLAGKVYPPNDEVPREAFEGNDRLIANMWEQFAIDTYPKGSKRVRITDGKPKAGDPLVWMTPAELVVVPTKA
jgi:hypothetical protein